MRPGTGGVVEVGTRKFSGSGRRRQEEVTGGLVICRSKFSGKQTSQAANGSNSDWRSRIRDGYPQ